LADRFPRHRLLMVTGAGQALTASTLGVLTLVGVVSLTHVLLLTLAAGTLRGLEHAARQGYTHDVVGGAALVPGMAVLGVAMRAGWLVGSLGVGAIIARYGSGAASIEVATGFLAGALPLLVASSGERPAPPPSGSLWKGVVDFAAATRNDGTLFVLMLITAGAEMLGFSHQVLLQSLARDDLRAGPEGLGALNAARSIGGILGLLAVSTRRPAAGVGALFLAVLVSFGGSLVALGVAPRFVGFGGVLIVLIVANAAGGVTDLLAQSLMQSSVPAALRGRAGGAWVVAIGLAPLGQLQIGALASLFGVSVALGVSGLGLVTLAGLAALLFPRMRRL